MNYLDECSIYNTFEMYNVFQHDLNQAQADLLASERAKEERRNRSAQHIKDRMVQNYKQRIVRNVALMSLEPAGKTVAHSKPYVGEAFFRHKPKDSCERVQDHLEVNKWLDTIPNPKPAFRLRKRTPSKELHSDMRFQPRDRYQRLSEVWDYQKGILDSTWSMSPSSQVPISMNKTYYKAIETIANEVSKDEPEVVKMAKSVRDAFVSPTNFKSNSTYY